MRLFTGKTSNQWINNFASLLFILSDFYYEHHCQMIYIFNLPQETDIPGGTEKSTARIN